MTNEEVIVRQARELYYLKKKMRVIEELIEDINLSMIDDLGIKHRIIDISNLLSTTEDLDL